MPAPTPPLDLTALSPQALTPTGRLHGQITIKWPYSASTQKLTFLLADPDIRRRALGGQVKVTLAGGAAEFVDRIESGEEVSLTAGGKALEAVPETDTPRVKWHITFPHGCTITTKDSSPQVFGPPKAPEPVVPPRLPRIPTPPVPTQEGLWKTPLKRKFEELTDHAITSTLTDEEEWFGTQPRLSSAETSRRFSGRMRFIGPDSQTSTPRSSAHDENSWAAPKRVVSPAVLRAQDLVAQQILGEKLARPVGVDEPSRVAEGGSRAGERSFDVFVDEEDVLPRELTKPAVTVDTPSEREESDVASESEDVEEESELELEASGRPLPVNEKRYYHPREESTSEDEDTGSDRVDYDYAQSYVDDEEEYEREDGEEEEMHPSRWRPEDGSVQSDEEEESELEESESELEEQVDVSKEPVVVDLTLDSDEDDQLIEPRTYDEDGEMEYESQEYEGEEYESGEEEEEDEEEEDYGREFNSPSSWQGIQSATPFTDLSRPHSHHSPAPISQILNQDTPPLHPQSALPADLQAHFFPSDLTHPTLTAPLDDIPHSFPIDFVAQALDPAMFQAIPLTTDLPLPTEMPQLSTEIPPVSTLHDTYDFQQLEKFAQDALDQVLAAATPLPQWREPDGHVDNVDSAAQQEFLTGLMPMTEMEILPPQHHPSEPEFLPTIVPQEPTQQEPKPRTEPIEHESPHPPAPTVEGTVSPSPPALSPEWAKDGFQTQYGYYPPLSTIRPPSLREQKANLTVDAIGIIRSTNPPVKIPKRDHHLSLFLVDPSTGAQKGVSTQLFRPFLEGLPTGARVGMVLLVTNMKVQSFEHRGQIRSTEESGWILFDEAGKVVGEGAPVEMGEEEREMVRQLRHWWRKLPAEEKTVDEPKENGANGEPEKADEENAVNGRVESARRGGLKMKYVARRGSRRVNLNR